MARRIRVTEHVRRDIIVEGTEAEAAFAVSELYSGRSSSPEIGEKIGFAVTVDENVEEPDAPRGEKCPRCVDGKVSVNTINKTQFRCDFCKGLGMMLSERNTKVDSALDVIFDDVADL